MSCHVISRLVLLHKLDTWSHNMSCHVMSSHVFSLVVSCHVTSCHVMSCHLTSSHVLSRLVISCHVMSGHVLSCHVMSCHVMSCHVMSCHVMSSHVFSCLSRIVISCHVMSCHVILLENLAPGFLNSSIMAAGWPRRGFRNRGFVRESGSERRSRCGAACTGSVSRACRVAGVGTGATWASFCVAGCGDRACCEHAGRCVSGVSRRCAVGIGFRACFVHAWPTCVSRGRLRELCVLASGGVPGACPRAVSAAPCRGDWVRGVSCAHDFTRCDLRFAWQVWDFGCIDALGKALDGGSASQAQ